MEIQGKDIGVEDITFLTKGFPLVLVDELKTQLTHTTELNRWLVYDETNERFLF